MSHFKPEGWPNVIPRIITADVPSMVSFLKVVFDAQGALRAGAPSEITIGNSIVMVSDGGDIRTATSAFLYVYVENADETYRRAVAAGAEPMEEPADMPYGDRRAMIRDPYGNLWQIASHKAFK